MKLSFKCALMTSFVLLAAVLAVNCKMTSGDSTLQRGGESEEIPPELRLVGSYDEICADYFFDDWLPRCLNLAQELQVPPEIMAVCIEAFSRNAGRLQCFKLAVSAGMDESQIDLCDQAFHKETEEFACMQFVASVHIAAEELEACHLSFKVGKDKMSCFEKVHNTGIKAAQIDACTLILRRKGDRMRCIETVSHRHLQPDQISGCKESFDMASSILLCLNNL